MDSDDPRTDDGRRGRPDVPRVGDLSPEEVAALVKRRRQRRRLKALAALGLATAAGLFLACAGRRPVTRTPEAGVDGGPGRDAATRDSSTGAMDGGMDAGIADAAVDVEHHRDGMPVPDNLLE